MHYANSRCTCTEHVDQESGKHVYRYSGPCIVTGKTVTVDVPAEALYAYRQGALMQEAMPMLSDDDREFLITGMSPEGWQQTFGDEPENVEFDDIPSDVQMFPALLKACKALMALVERDYAGHDAIAEWADAKAVIDAIDAPPTVCRAVLTADGLACPNCGNGDDLVAMDTVDRRFTVEIDADEKLVRYNSESQRMMWDGCTDTVLTCTCCGAELELPDDEWVMESD